jgi:hypothetical protein
MLEARKAKPNPIFLTQSHEAHKVSVSSHQKRVVQFAGWLCEEILKTVPHQHLSFSLPKILRRYFLYDRILLSDVSHYGRESLKTFLATII